jgi:hypothetical protein
MKEPARLKTPKEGSTKGRKKRERREKRKKKITATFAFFLESPFLFLY